MNWTLDDIADFEQFVFMCLAPIDRPDWQIQGKKVIRLGNLADHYY